MQYQLCNCSCLAGTCKKSVVNYGLNVGGKECSLSYIFKYYSVRLLRVGLSPKSSEPLEAPFISGVHMHLSSVLCAWLSNWDGIRNAGAVALLDTSFDCLWWFSCCCFCLVFLFMEEMGNVWLKLA